ncbi:hypothetical protein B0A58_05210 [Flavobacterium branchiophilum NBRC 15030 = ATCC 35035]|uniref:OOP family OmpA-OmpF porin n=1 Tax=Flavobacterium branchiophilum TaxID=55197 RepID=A0A543G1T6_9FLAO|nr:OmpA family protein [Flavobacterium branchiophilum]OXA77786.1 hypothetical protein B0A58_05210 [Flavobacterium branchiophilum NBRC 15030 = ATCC 35035]TQM40053.1 OOP family OmpA-OmpF porin [Flavobacterium branchiophilum]GEM56018.1 hypothetical protein FB1_22390 [Flavobacterium branchiophilum NBRC 15030 = ATCC 35035]
MKKSLIAFTLVAFGQYATAQDNSKVKEDKPYNQWSVEVAAGGNKPIRPFTTGFNNSDGNTYFANPKFNHYEFGIRYMVNPKFGLKLDFGYDNINNRSGSYSPATFENIQYRIGVQTVINVGRVLNFESFTSRIGLLFHGGIQVAQLTPKIGPFKETTEDNGGIIYGVTPQFRVSKKFVITADVSAISNFRQHYSWDGYSNFLDNTANNRSDNLSGLMYNTSVGLTYYLGSKEKHADWYVEQATVAATVDAAVNKLSSLETMLQDTDKDGIADYLDVQNDTPPGIAVDSHGNAITAPITGGINGENGSNGVVTKSDAIRDLADKGYLNVFYDVNKDTPNAGSTNNIFHIIKFMNFYPDAKVKLVGYTDKRGNNVKNKALSERRAQKLYQTLVASGIAADRISITGEGIDKTYTNDPSSIGMDLSRRVSLVLE